MGNKMKTLHFVNVRLKNGRMITASQHRKKILALKELIKLKKKGFSGKVISKRARWTY